MADGRHAVDPPASDYIGLSAIHLHTVKHGTPICLVAVLRAPKPAVNILGPPPAAARLRGSADAQPSREVKGILCGRKAEVRAVPGARRAYLDRAAECLLENIGDLRDRRLLIGMERPIVGSAFWPLVTGPSCGSSASLELSHRPAFGGGRTPERTAGGLILDEEQGSTMTFGQLSTLDQLERFVGKLE